MTTSLRITLLVALSMTFALPACTKKKAEEKPVEAKPAGPVIHLATPAPMTMPAWDASKAITGPEGLQYIILHKGDGAKPSTGKTVVVHYAGWLLDGRNVDASVDQHKPFSFVLGCGQVIRGWDLAVQDVLVG